MQASLVDINAGDEQGRTALHIAAEKSNLEITTILLLKHADVNCKTNLVQFTPLHLACQQLTPNKQVSYIHTFLIDSHLDKKLIEIYNLISVCYNYTLHLQCVYV